MGRAMRMLTFADSGIVLWGEGSQTSCPPRCRVPSYGTIVRIKRWDMCRGLSALLSDNVLINISKKAQ